MAAAGMGGSGKALTVFLYDRRKEDTADSGEKVLKCREETFEGFRRAVCQVTAVFLLLLRCVCVYAERRR